MLGSITLLLFVRAFTHAYEGFVAPVSPVQGELPAATQVSYIPRDSASATTANPQLAKPDYRDWADARESFQYFLEVYRPGEEAMFLEAPVHLRAIEDYILNPESVPSRAILERAKEARRLADSMRRVGAADPWNGWEQPSCISYGNDDLMA